MKNDVEAKIKADEETGEMKMSHAVSLWLESIQNIQEVILFIYICPFFTKCFTMCVMLLFT